MIIYANLLSPVVDCGVPPMVASSTRTFPPTTFGQSVTYSCQDNFVLSGNSTLTCMASGSWGTPPICSRQSIVTHKDMHYVIYIFICLVQLFVRTFPHLLMEGD